jgi:L-amino acid N-acyltransferase YncA
MAGNGAGINVSLPEYITQVTNELTERVEHQRRVFMKLVEERERAGRPLEYCVLVDCGPRKKYRAAVQETIHVLKETRSAFKSKQLEELRKRLETLLAAEQGGEL